jgi:formate dehydrogenase major subunit
VSIALPRIASECAGGAVGVSGEIYAEMASLVPTLDNISWERIERKSSTTYFSDAPDKPGHGVVFTDRFPTQDGRGSCPARIIPPDERPDAEYPFALLSQSLNLSSPALFDHVLSRAAQRRGSNDTRWTPAERRAATADDQERPDASAGDA